MNNKLIVFQEKDYYFGLFPEDFERHLRLDNIWVHPSDISSSIWNFYDPVSKKKGYYVHLGALFGYNSISFSSKGYIFIKDLTDFNFGIFMDHYWMKLHLDDKKKNQLSIHEIQDIPSSIPKDAFKYILLYKKKKIIIIEPLMLLRSYNNLFPINT